MEDTFGGGLGFEIVEGGHGGKEERGERDGEWGSGKWMSRCRIQEETHVKLMEICATARLTRSASATQDPT